MADTPAFLAQRLKTEGEKTAAFFDGLSDEQWQIEVYTEDEPWTIRNILAHFVTAEQGFLRLFEVILEGGVGASDDFSIDRFNASQQEKTRDLDPRELLKRFREIRARMVRWVEARAEDDLLIEGRHPFLGQVKLGDMIKMVYRHNQIHFRDVRSLME